MNTKPQQQNANPWLFFALTLIWTWSFWGMAAITGKPMDAAPVPLLIGLGGVGPTAATLILLYTRNDAPTRRAYWRRVFDVRRISPVWWGIIFGFTPLLTLAAVGMDAVLGAGGQFNPQSEFLTGSVLTLGASALFTLFFGPVPEELGWRGYALERLQTRYGVYFATLILGAIWAIWHLPLFTIPGSYQHALGIGTPGFWRYLLTILPETFLITWIFNHTSKSTLAAILFHFVTNFNPVESLFVLSPTGQWLQLGLRLLAAVGVALWGFTRTEAV